MWVFSIQILTVCLFHQLINGINCSTEDGLRNEIPGIYNTEETKVVPIVTVYPGRLNIDTFALHSILDKVGDSPFGIYSINGPSRTGKSYLLSRFVQYLSGTYDHPATSEGFEWRGASDRCTRGINMWADPLHVSLGNGSTIPVLLVDTQGCFEENSPLELDAKVFAIATLLSSVQIFNTIRNLDEATLQFLEAFIGVASMANTQGTDTAPDFQKLLLLIRDFQFTDYKFGYYDNTHRPVAETKNFKMDKINPRATQPTGHQATRGNIINSFQETAVFLMPHPGKDLSMHDNPEQLDVEFKSCQDDLMRLLFHPNNLVMKKVNGVRVSGLDFKRHVSTWMDVLQKMQNLKLPKTSEAASEIQFLTGLEAGRKEYMQILESLLHSQQFRIEKQVLDNKHKETLDSLSKSFAQKIYFRKHNQNRERFRAELELWANEQLVKYFEANSQKCEYLVYIIKTTWWNLYPYLIYILATAVLVKLFRWLLFF